MARGQQNKLYRTFNKGLITEAGFLTYPEDASTDELNTVIHRKGNRSRRFGLDYEPDSTAVSLLTYGSDEVTSEFLWRAVANKSSINFLCVQVGNKIHFFDASSEPISSGQKSFTVDLDTYKSSIATLAQVRGTHVHMASGKGYLFIVQEYLDPIVVDYDVDEDNITVVRVRIQVRDFDGVNDGLANDEEPTSLSAEHHYNLRNQGWVEPGTYPDYGGGETGGSGGDYTGGGAIPDQDTTETYDPYTGNIHIRNPNQSEDLP